MKVKGYFLLLASLLILASCGKQEKSNSIAENGSVVEDTQSKPTPEANILLFCKLISAPFCKLFGAISGVAA